VSETRNSLDDGAFGCQARKNGGVEISWHGKPVKTLGGAEAAKFLSRVEDADERTAQLLMARATGDFKRGNGRRSSR
jgi:hypothetical protein